MAIQNSLNLTTTGIVAADGAGVFTGRTITGTADFIDVADGTGVSGNPTFSINTKFEETGMHGWNGCLLETAAVTAASDGATITFSVELNGGGDLDVVFSDGYYLWDTTPADTVTLTAGTDTVPVQNYVYFLQSTKTLTASTVGWPASEHAPLATVLCQSAATFQTDGPYKFHAWTDHVISSINEGHIPDINFWIRKQPATYESGVAQTFTITTNGGAADNVILTTASGVVLQLHDQIFPAFSGTPDVYVVNDNATPYTKVTDLNALLTDATGASMTGKYFSLVIWGCVSENSADCKLFCNLPGGSYNSSANLIADPDSYANFDIPSDFTGTGFLIAQWNLRHQSAASGTWTSIEEIDLRGLVPSIVPGGSAAFPSEFVDTAFRIFDDGDDTKKIAFQASGITTATTRTLTVPDADGTIAYASGLDANGFAYALDGNTLDSTLAATNGQLLIGSTGVVPVAASLTAPAAGLTITGGAGSITFALADDLAALEGLSGTGVLARTAADTYAERTITGTASRISMTNGDGVAGNPTIDIDAAYVGQASITTLGTVATGTWEATDVGVAHGGTGRSSHTAYAVICGGTTATGAQQSIAGVGTSGQVLTSNGAGALPTFQAASIVSPVTVPDGGTGLTTITDGGIMLGSGTGAVTPLALTDGQVAAGITSGDPVASDFSWIGLEGGAVWNLGFTLAAGVFSITGYDGTALSAANPAFAWMQDKTDPGKGRLFKITSGWNFTDDTGTSDIAGQTFGTTASVAWADVMPFYVHLVQNDDESTLMAMITRNPRNELTPTAANIGDPSATVTGVQNAWFAFDDITEADYEQNPVLCIGTIKMTKSASDDWTVTLGTTEGVGKFNEDTRFLMPYGQNGAQSGTYITSGTGTEPTSSTRQMYYTMYRNGEFKVDINFNVNNTPSGAGGFKFAMPLQSIEAFTLNEANGFWIDAGTSKLVRYFQQANLFPLEGFVIDGSGSVLTFASFASGDAVRLSHTIKAF